MILIAFLILILIFIYMLAILLMGFLENAWMQFRKTCRRSPYKTLRYDFLVKGKKYNRLMARANCNAEQIPLFDCEMCAICLQNFKLTDRIGILKCKHCNFQQVYFYFFMKMVKNLSRVANLSRFYSLAMIFLNIIIFLIIFQEVL